jgi:hypothetical protein
MGIFNNVEINKTRANSFPQTQNVTITSATSLKLTCTGDNGVSYVFQNSGDTGTIEPKESIEFFTNIDPVTDVIELTFIGASNIEVSYATGTGGGGGGGDATASNQVIIINILSGNIETLEFFQNTTAGTFATDTALSMSIVFNGGGGALNGITVENGFSVSYSGTERNQIEPINYTVPTTPNFNGFQRVLISYTKL